DLVGVIGARQENEQLEHMANGKVDERPQLTLDSRTSHRGEGSREGVGPESPCSTARSIIRTLRVSAGRTSTHLISTNASAKKSSVSPTFAPTGTGST